MVIDVSFNFGDENTFATRNVKLKGIRLEKIKKFIATPLPYEGKDVDEYYVEDIRVQIQGTKNNELILAAIAPNGSSGVAKYKIQIEYDQS